MSLFTRTLPEWSVALGRRYHRRGQVGGIRYFEYAIAAKVIAARSVLDYTQCTI